jgi:predicted transcriptional regulator
MTLERSTPGSRVQAAKPRIDAMTNITVSLSDELAQRVQQAGLLSSSAIAQLLEEAMRRRAGRQLLDIAKRVQAAGIPPMSDEEVAAEVKAVRAERRARQLKDTSAGGS